MGVGWRALPGEQLDQRSRVNFELYGWSHIHVPDSSFAGPKARPICLKETLVARNRSCPVVAFAHA